MKDSQNNNHGVRRLGGVMLSYYSEDFGKNEHTQNKCVSGASWRDLGKSLKISLKVLFSEQKPESVEVADVRETKRNLAIGHAS
jgi:hypothetical protein